MKARDGVRRRDEGEDIAAADLASHANEVVLQVRLRLEFSLASSGRCSEDFAGVLPGGVHGFGEGVQDAAVSTFWRPRFAGFGCGRG
jgi:hypothetical protein